MTNLLQSNVILLHEIYNQVLGEYKTEGELLWKHRGGFIHYLKEGVKQKKLNPQFYKNAHNVRRLSYALEISHDSLLSYAELKRISDNYFIKDDRNSLMETPQYFWMRIAMGLSVNEKDTTTAAINLYNALSTLEYKARAKDLQFSGILV